jgi:hypothetical protein
MMRLSKRKINFHIYYIQYDRIYVETKHVTVIPGLRKTKKMSFLKHLLFIMTDDTKTTIR